MKHLWRIGVLISFSLFLVSGCSAQPTVVASPTSAAASPTAPAATTTPILPTATSSPTSAPSPTPTATPLPPAHAIALRTVNGRAEFYDRRTGEKFVPRGNNYVRLAPMAGAPGGMWHATMNPGFYHPALTEEAFRQMHADGYNVIRVFVDCCRKGNNAGDPAGGISTTYVDVVVDLLKRAKANGLFVLMILDRLPADGDYSERWTWCCKIFDGANVDYMTPGGDTAKRRFDQDFIRALIKRQAPMDAIWAFDLANEVFFESDRAPLNWLSGSVTTANGRTYDMAKADDKQRMMDENLVYWIDRQRAAILEVDPTALVTVSFFWPQKPNPARRGDNRVIRTYPALAQSTADFVDLHAYPGQELTLAQYAENFELKGVTKPIVMGEFGASRNSFNSAEAAARALHDWQVASCRFGFSGWLLWTFDTAEQTDFFNGMGDGGLINQVLAPSNRPDPCKPGSFSFFKDDVALGRPVRASHELAEQPASLAVDGTTATAWNSGDFPPQWIEIDLGKAYAISEIRLTVAMYPLVAQTTHRVLGKGPGAGGEYRLLHTFAQETREQGVLSFTPGAAWQGIQYVRVETVASPSWVGWREIEVFSPH